MSDSDSPHEQPPPERDAPSASVWEAILDRVREAVSPRFEVERLIGFGGMAGVYLANEPSLGRQVAIKVMSPSLMMDPGLVQRFRQEARTIAQLDHSNIITIYDVREGEDLHYFVMAYLPGRTVGHVMREVQGPLPLDVINAWMYQIGSALDYAHGYGVVHRDVKPGNILLDARGNALVTDFGIAKVADQEGLTRTGMLVGTPAYMSPEQCSSAEAGPASDQYSLGALAYQMLTGEPPFSGPTLAVLHAHVSQPPQPVQAIRPDCPAPMAEAVDRMLAKRPRERWTSLGRALEAMGAAPVGHGAPVQQRLIDLAAAVERVTVSSPSGARRPPVPSDDIVTGETFLAEAIVTGRDGRILKGRTVRWTSEAPSVARVMPDGRVVALAPGTARVTGECGSVRDSIVFRVVQNRDGAEVSVPPREVPAGARIGLAEILPDATGLSAGPNSGWGSTRPDVARITGHGELQALRPGTTMVTAFREGRAVVAELTVTAAGEEGSGLGDARASTPIPVSSVRAETPTPASSTPASGGVTRAPGEAIPPPGEATPAPVDAAARSSPSLPDGPARDSVPGSSPRTSDAAHPRRLGPVPVLAGVGIVAALLLLGAGVYFFAGSGDEPEQADGILQVADLPPDALAVLLLDGEEVVLEPGAGHSLPPGDYRVRVTGEGYRPYEGVITLAAGVTFDWSPVLLSSQDPEGAVRVAGLPSGARAVLIVEGSELVLGSGEEISLPPGSYQARVTAPGYETHEGLVTVQEGETSEWRPTLREVVEAPRFGTVRVAGLPPEARAVLLVEGSEVAVVPGQGVELTPGSYQARVTAEGYEPYESQVTVTAGQTLDWRPELRPLSDPDLDPDRDPDSDPDTTDLDPDVDMARLRAGIDRLLSSFADGFESRDMDQVLQLFLETPGDWAARWRLLIEDPQNARDLTAEAHGLQGLQLDGEGRASGTFSLRLEYRTYRNTVETASLAFHAVFERRDDAWLFRELTEVF